MSPEEELSLAARVKAGDKKALGLLWDAITPKLYGYLLNVLRDKTTAEDIFGQTWLKAISKINLFKAMGVRFSAWLFAIARNECKQQWRTRKYESMGEAIEDEPRSENENHQDKIFVKQILEKMTEDDRELLKLRYIAELSFKEMATVLNISAISARVRVHRALGRARSIIKQ